MIRLKKVRSPTVLNLKCCYRSCCKKTLIIVLLSFTCRKRILDLEESWNMSKDPGLSSRTQKEASTIRMIIKIISTQIKNIRKMMIKIMFNFLYCFYYPEIKEVIQ